MKTRNVRFSVVLMVLLLMWTMDAYASPDRAREIFNGLLYSKPVVRDGKVVLPASPDKDYIITIGGSSNEAVVTPGGDVFTPLETMDVHLLYKVVNRNDTSDFYMSTNHDVTLRIPGKYAAGEKDNARPKVLPEIQEWKGDRGVFRLGKGSRIVVASHSLMDAAVQVNRYISHFTGTPLEIIESNDPKKGDICFRLSDRKDLGNEGYYIELGDFVMAEASSAHGCLYAGVTLAQILSQSDGHNTLPKGYIRDYPAYGIRGCMLDVARIYIPLGYLEEMVRYMAWFKINEVQVHINDDSGEQQSCFRVESKRFPAINSGIKPSEVYSQDDYRQFQKDMAVLGVDIITEIDTPAHCRFVMLHDPSLMLDDGNVRLDSPEAISFMKELYDEFLDGDDPVFQSRNFHIGADEYHRGTRYGEAFNLYCNEMIGHVRSKGLQPRMWASLGGGGMVGETPVDNSAIANYWAYSWADFDRMISNGYRCLNNSHDLYVVPGKLTGYEDYFRLEKMYCSWEATDLSGNWPVLSPAHPLLMGCQASVWYDRKVGISQFDYFDRQKDQAVFIAEKGWNGQKRSWQSWERFNERIVLNSGDVPDVNPLRKVESRTPVVVSYDFRKGGRDKSGNGYDAVIDGLVADDGVLKLDGKGLFRLPFDAIGYPYNVSMDICIDPTIQPDALLFGGKDGVMYLNYGGTGKIGYERKGYRYVLDSVLPVDRWISITLSCDRSQVYLYVNGELVAQGRYAEDPSANPDSSTFILPTEKICSGVAGRLRNFKIYR